MSGKHAYGYCDKTGFRYPLRDLVPEYRNGVKTGHLVGRDVADRDHPQNFLDRLVFDDPRPLKDPRPDRSVDSAFGFDPVGGLFMELRGFVGDVVFKGGG